GPTSVVISADPCLHAHVRTGDTHVVTRRIRVGRHRGVLRPPIWHQEPVSWPLSDHADRRENRVTALTFAEARERSRLLAVRGSRGELDVAGGGEAFGSATVVRFGCRAPGAGSFIELSPARLRRAVLNGREVDPATLAGNRLPLPGLRETN